LKTKLTLLSLLALAGMAFAAPFPLRRPVGLIEPDIPIDQPLTTEVVALGKRLFFDPRLSASGRTSCSSCHDPVAGFADSRRLSLKDNGSSTARHAPSVLNAGYLPTTMWDGKYRTLEQQVFDTFKPNGDMGHYVGDAVTAIASDPEYQRLFDRAFQAGASADRMATAIAQFERSLVSGDSPFDKHIFLRDKSALTDEQKLGLKVFSSKAGCLNCHDVFHPDFNPLGGGSALFTDFRFHNLGVGYKAGRFGDTGRFTITRDPADVGAFRTPSLRNVAERAPYMHDGSLATLEEVIDFYNKGGNANPNLSPSMRPLYLTAEEKRLLVVFLKALSDPSAKKAAGRAD